MAVDTTDYLALTPRIWGKMVAKHAADSAKPRFQAAMDAVADAAAMALPHVAAEPCEPVEIYCRPRYVYHGYICFTHMDLSMRNGRLFLNTDMRQDCISIFFDKETGGALLLYHAQSEDVCGFVDGHYTLPAGATMRDIVRTFCGADCEIGYTSVWRGRSIPNQRTEFLGFPMSALGTVETKHEINIHVRKTTPLRPTTGQMVDGVFVN